jgi:hypothetical protein
MPIGLLIYALVQLLLAICFVFFPRRGKFRTSRHLVFLNAAVVVVCVSYNLRYQLFCLPVLWTIPLLVFSTLGFILLPVYRNKHWVTALLLALNAFIWLYILLFAGSAYYYFALFNLPLIIAVHFLMRWVDKRLSGSVAQAFYLYPALILAPFFVFWQLWLFQKELSGKLRYTAVGIGLCMVLIFAAGAHRMKQLSIELGSTEQPLALLQDKIRNPIDRYFTELLLGAHWKYHTQLFLYDGWRPPYHDPFVGATDILWYPGGTKRIEQGMEWQEARTLYFQLFPEKVRDFSCKCGFRQTLY